MKYKVLQIVLCLTVLFFSSCSVNRYVAPPFTDLDRILDLEPGMTVSKVTNILLIPPYDMVHSYETGSMILVYNYRVKDRNMPVPTRAANQIIHSEEGQREGDEWYNNNYQELYLLFKNDTLKSVFGERSFSEGNYIEMIDRRLNTSALVADSTSIVSESDYLFLQNFYRERTSFKEAILLQKDEALEKRRNFLKTAAYALIAAVAVIGVFGK